MLIITYFKGFDGAPYSAILDSMNSFSTWCDTAEPRVFWIVDTKDISKVYAYGCTETETGGAYINMFHPE